MIGTRGLASRRVLSSSPACALSPSNETTAMVVGVWWSAERGVSWLLSPSNRVRVRSRGPCSTRRCRIGTTRPGGSVRPFERNRERRVVVVVGVCWIASPATRGTRRIRTTMATRTTAGTSSTAGRSLVRSQGRDIPSTRAGQHRMPHPRCRTPLLANSIQNVELSRGALRLARTADQRYSRLP